CTFTNQQLGHIIVHKAIHGPADTTTSFDFSSNYGADFSLNSTQTNDSGPLVTGTYNVSEHAKANWHLFGTPTCGDGSPVTAIALAPGETVNCTFTNELLVGSITISKHAKRAGQGVVPEANVGFVVTRNSDNAVVGNLTTGADGTVCLDGLFFGDYTVHENVPAGESVDQND